MSTAGVFLLAPSLARLIEKEREGHRVRQGYFPDRPDRGNHVQVEGETGQLILVPITRTVRSRRSRTFLALRPRLCLGSPRLEL